LPQAKKTVGQYVEYISKYVEGVLQQMNNEAAMQQQLQQVQQQGGLCCALRELHLAIIATSNSYQQPFVYELLAAPARMYMLLLAASVVRCSVVHRLPNCNSLLQHLSTNVSPPTLSPLLCAVNFVQKHLKRLRLQQQRWQP
jgi:hypothetical protein